MSAAPPVRAGRVVLALATVSVLGSAAVHMIVPALPALATDLRVSPAAAQYAISSYLFGLAAGQLAVGPALDSFGRRPILIAGLSLYLVGAALAAGAGSMVSVCLFRGLQALGAGAGLVTARVVVGDIFDKADAGRGQARLMAVVLISPAIAPAIGGYATGLWGWRGVLALQAAGAVVVLAYMWRAFPETLARAAPSRGLAAYRQVLRNGAFRRMALAIALCSSALYVFLSMAPFILIDTWGHPPGEAGLYFLLTALAAIGGTFLVGRLERRLDTFRLGLGICVCGALFAVAMAFFGPASWAALIAPAMVVTLGVGVAGPSGIARILQIEEGLAGTAMSLSGALQMCMGGLAASAAGMIAAPSFRMLATAMIVCVGAAYLAAPRK